MGEGQELLTWSSVPGKLTRQGQREQGKKPLSPWYAAGRSGGRMSSRIATPVKVEAVPNLCTMVISVRALGSRVFALRM